MGFGHGQRTCLSWSTFNSSPHIAAGGRPGRCPSLLMRTLSPSSSSSSSYVPPCPLISSCVYNVPMPLDLALEHTRGLEPQHAKSRNLHMVQSSRSFVLGPMPTGDFLEQFLPLAHPFDMVSLIAWHRNAFRTVPERGASVMEIQGPLVRFPYASISCCYEPQD